MGKDPTVTALREMRAELAGAGVAWDQVRDEMHAIIAALRTQFDTGPFDAEAEADELVRLADGKSLLNRLRGQFNPTGRWEGHLAAGLTRPPYADEFRQQILAATAA